ncbi:hypothetical protein [Umezawaea beigongshangensis]|uniref:hypothetical protein n=1 Tax=Umezawaea beigongshangensis TaxID=2780383 RepID=UPI0018F17A0F|nr:hypothetical protein [Umezawaea beigongshangensis]
MTAPTDLAPTPAHRLARLATEVLAPWVWVLGLPLAIGWHATGTPGGTLLWGLVVGVTGSVIPMLVIVRGARRGAWEGHHVTNREGRVIPFAVCTSSLAVGIAILVLGGAPGEMTALAVAMFVTLVVSVTITFGLHWKVSMHAAVASGAVVMLVAAYGPLLALLTPAVVLVCWSRVELRDHTTAQVWVGAAVGVLAGGLPHWALVTTVLA